MHALVVTDDSLLGAKISAAALRCGLVCEATDIVGLDSVAEWFNRSRRDVVMLALPADRARALAALREVRHATPGSVLVVGAADDPKFILRVLREGADEFVDVADLEADLETALTRLRSKQQGPAGESGRVIGVLGCGGGSGASTVAANLAVALAKKHEHSLLMDLRLTAGDQSLLLDAKPTHTISELCLNCERMDASMFQQVLKRHHTGVHLLAAPSNAEGVAHVTPQGVRQVLTQSRSLFPFTVIDFDRALGPEQLPALSQVDLLLLVLRLDMTSLCSAQRLLDQVGRLGLPDKHVQVVVNRFGQPKELPAGKAERVLGVHLAHYVPDDPATVNSANNKGVPLIVERPRSKVARSLVELSARAEDAGQLHHANGHAVNGRRVSGGFFSRLWATPAGHAQK